MVSPVAPAAHVQLLSLRHQPACDLHHVGEVVDPVR